MSDGRVGVGCKLLEVMMSRGDDRSLFALSQILTLLGLFASPSNRAFG